MNMKKIIPTRFAEIIFALVIGVFGALHLKYGGSGEGVPSFMPGNPGLWMYITGTGFALAAIAILLNKFKTLACYLLATMMMVFIFTIHLPGSLKGASHYQLLKDIGLAMAAIIIGNGASKK
jgi:putative oxidoreductase